MTQVIRPYRGVSADDRRRERRSRLLVATLDVVGRDGVQGSTVDAVCSAAGLTKRYFYESFPDRDALLVAVMDDLFVDLRDRMRIAAGRRRSAAARARAVVDLLVSTLADDPRLARLYVESPGHGPLRARRDEAIGAFTDLLRLEILPADAAAGRRQSRRDEERRALAIRLVVGGTTDLVTSWLSGAVAADRGALVDTIVALGLAVDGAV